MNTISEVRNLMDELSATSSRNEKKAMLAEAFEATDYPEALAAILSPNEFDDVGLAKKSVHKAAQEAFGEFEAKPCVSEALADMADGDENAFDHPKEGEKYPPHDETLDHVLKTLEELDTISGNHQHEHLVAHFEHYLYPSVLSYAILSDEGLGVSDKTIGDALTDEREEALPFYESFRDFVVDATKGRLQTAPHVGKPFRPMKAKPESTGRPDNPVAQAKLDGYRLVLHVESGLRASRVRAFSRRMNDVTDSLPELQEIEWPVGDYILDCEVIAEDGTYKSTSERVGADDFDREQEMHFHIFDCIMYDSHDISDWTFEERMTAASHAIQNMDDERMWLVPYNDDIAREKQKARENGHEGIIVKDLEHEYQFGKRSSYWVKEKLTEETVDVVITDFEEGNRKHTGRLGKVHIETADGVPVGKCGSGWSDEQREEMWANPDEYRGSVIEVQAEAFDDALRFPTFQRFRDVDGEPDTLDEIENKLEEA